ncbi:T-complex 11 family-containing protein [Strongyloides ratti]|uniref:T-complex 11 family-containing protein n=1 Tax=Strongyloides ratti TaxID=34506 RepID=A0A090MUD9_STRRB|nr:T-complex 11 family-containing protein [Strongyloides ratti]CEF62168.1 T-complex 11 family-containing protein [Strongyloides ratti]
MSSKDDKKVEDDCKKEGEDDKSKPLHINIGDGSINFLPDWVGGSSPARFITAEEILSMNRTIEKMMIAHEIAVDPDFTIAKFTEPSTPLHRQVRDCLHKAYFDSLRDASFSNEESIKARYKEDMLDIFKTIRHQMLEVIPMSAITIQSEIKGLLDDEILRNQSDENIIDYYELTTKALTIVSKLCAANRDEMVGEALDEKELYEKIKKTLNVLKVMKIDYEDFALYQKRQLFMQHSCDYEREQFLKLLEVDKNAANITYQWLKKVFEGSEYSVLATLSNTEVSEVITQAYMCLLTQNPEEYPETFKFDEERLRKSSLEYYCLTILLTSIFIATNLSGKDIAEKKDFKKQLKRDLIALLDDLSFDNLKEKLESIYLQSNLEISKAAESFGSNHWSESQSKELKEQILSIENPNNPVRKIAASRISIFIQAIISERGQNNCRVPNGLSVIQDELIAMAKSFLYYVSHNRKTYGVLYGSFIDKMAKQS